MTPQLHVDAATLCTVTVTFNPDLALLEAQLRALPRACNKIIVDNASSVNLPSYLQSLAGCAPNTCVLRNGSNVGLSAAINRGVQAAAELEPTPEFVLLLDQDTVPQVGSIAALVEAFHVLERADRRVGCVGPLLLDPQTGLTHGFHQCTRWRWKRVYPPTASMTPVPCANLNGSGTLVPVELFLQLGGLDESLFIDHVDTEWSFRMLHAGYFLWGVPNATFIHRMGQASTRFWWFGWRVWPSRSPQRHFYLFRNAVLLMRRSYVPTVWKAWGAVKLFLTVLTTTLVGPNRLAQVAHMIKGIKAGIRTSH